MMRRLHRLATRTLARGRRPPADAPRPEMPFLAVGDIHGRADLLAELQARMAAGYARWPVVFLGDYVDRGPDSRRVLDLLMAQTAAGGATCLMGNHERMMLDFLHDPAGCGRLWLHNGGAATVASFDVEMPEGVQEDPAALMRLRDILQAAMGPERIAWLRALPLIWHSGPVWAVHAGAAPARAMERQSADVLLWGHPQFLRQARRDGQWIVHGHTIMKAPRVGDGRISIDTGAHATGVLSAAAISPGGIAFVQTGDGARALAGGAGLPSG